PSRRNCWRLQSQRNAARKEGSAGTLGSARVRFGIRYGGQCYCPAAARWCGMTHEEAKRLADMIRNAREEITESEWRAIANILRNHKRPAQPPLLDDRDKEGSRAQLAQHDAAYNVLE